MAEENACTAEKESRSAGYERAAGGFQIDEQQIVETLALVQIICGVVLCFGLRPALTAFRSWRRLSVPAQLSEAATSGSLMVTTAS